MTVTTTSVTTTPGDRVRELLRRVTAAAHALGAAIGARWRAEVAGGYFGADAEAIMGRGTGARV